jgi:hypothetical protein
MFPYKQEHQQKTPKEQCVNGFHPSKCDRFVYFIITSISMLNGSMQGKSAAKGSDYARIITFTPAKTTCKSFHYSHFC